MEILLKKLFWPALAAEANFPNICLLGTFRTCVETTWALEWGNPGLKSDRREQKNGKFVLPKYYNSNKNIRVPPVALRSKALTFVQKAFCTSEYSVHSGTTLLIQRPIHQYFHHTFGRYTAARIFCSRC